MPPDAANDPLAASPGKTEAAEDLDKMRAVANSSSREAIQHWDLRRLRRTVMRSIWVGLFLLIGGGTAIAMSPSPLRLQAVSGMIALVLGSCVLLYSGRVFYRWRRCKNTWQAAVDTERDS